MLRRSLLGPIAPLAVALLLIGCGNPSSEEANQASSEDGYDQTAATDADASSGYDDGDGYADEEGDYDREGYDSGTRGTTSTSGRREPSQLAARQPQSYAPRRPVARQVATPAVGAGVRGDVGMFYDALDRDGSWVKHPDYEYVWLPARMGAGWRPYQEGRWIWTEDYGWYWESEEPFAWAVYHYGRWDYDPDYGWFWVPGDTWAPAWVTWRTGGQEIGWAPIAPDRRGFAAGPPRRYAPPVAESWVFVEAPHFSEPDLSPFIRPVHRIGASLEIAREVRTPRWERDRMINFGAPPSELRRYLRQPAPTRQLVYVGDRADMFEDMKGRRMGIYRPTIVSVENRRPPRRLGDVRDVARVILAAFAEPASERHYDAPSAALLDVLDRRERQSLIEVRMSAKQAALDAEVERLREERAELIEKRRRQAKKLEAKLEREREEARAERERLREAIRAEKRKRADEITIEAAAPPAAPAAAPEQAPMPAPAPAESVTVPAEPVPPVDLGAREGDDRDRGKKRRDRARDDRREQAPAAVEPEAAPEEPNSEAAAKPSPPEKEAPSPLIQVNPAPAAGEEPPPLIQVNPAPTADKPLLQIAPKREAAPSAEQAPSSPPEEAESETGEEKTPLRRRPPEEDEAGEPAAMEKSQEGKRRKSRPTPPEEGEAEAPPETAAPPAAEEREGRREAPADPVTGVLEGAQGALNSLGLGEPAPKRQANPGVAEQPRKAKKRPAEEPAPAEDAEQDAASEPAAAPDAADVSVEPPPQ